MDITNLPPFSQQLITLLMSGEELPGHIVDAIHNYYEMPAEKRNAPLTSVPQQPAMQNQNQASLRDMLTRNNPASKGLSQQFGANPALNPNFAQNMPQAAPMAPFGVGQQNAGLSSFPRMSQSNWPPAGMPQKQQPQQPQGPGPLAPGINYGPLR